MGPLWPLQLISAKSYATLVIASSSLMDPCTTPLMVPDQISPVMCPSHIGLPSTNILPDVQGGGGGRKLRTRWVGLLFDQISWADPTVLAWSCHLSHHCM